MAQRRIVNTPYGPVTYTLEKKRVKNMNLRIRPGEEVHLSVPLRCSAEEADELILSKSEWIVSAMARTAETEKPLCGVEREECLRRLKESLDRVYPLVEPLGIPRPALKVRRMTSQWGNCHYMQGYITLNTALASCPEELRDYVALHELVHFLHQDHGPGFYGTMDRLMPDWQKRRKALRAYEPGLRKKGVT